MVLNKVFVFYLTYPVPFFFVTSIGAMGVFEIPKKDNEKEMKDNYVNWGNSTI